MEYNGVSSGVVTVPVLDSRPGILTLGASGNGQTAVLNQDGTVNSRFNAAARGSVVSIYVTGAGLPEPPGADDQISGDGLSTFKSPARVRLDGASDKSYFEAEVRYYGGAPLSVAGLFQIDARLPLNVPPGDAVPLYFSFSAVPGSGGIEQQVTIAIR